MVLLGDEAQVDALSVCLEILLILTQEGAQFAPNAPQARKLFWMHTMELLGEVGHVKSSFGLFVENVSVSAR
jgi:hypothetical protein